MFRALRFRILGPSFSCFGVFVFVFWGLVCFCVLGSSFSCFGVLGIQSSFSGSSFSQLPSRNTSNY